MHGIILQSRSDLFNILYDLRSLFAWALLGACKILIFLKTIISVD